MKHLNIAFLVLLVNLTSDAVAQIIKYVKPVASGIGAASSMGQHPGRADTDSLWRQVELIKKESRERAAKSNYNYYIINNEAGGYGYCVLVNGHVYVWQTSIPGRKGIKGFAKKEYADRCAQLVVEKLKAGEMPPTLTEADLKKIL